MSWLLTLEALHLPVSNRPGRGWRTVGAAKMAETRGLRTALASQVAPPLRGWGLKWAGLACFGCDWRPFFEVNTAVGLPLSFYSQELRVLWLVECAAGIHALSVQPQRLLLAFPQTLFPTLDTMVSGKIWIQNSICGYSPRIIYRHHEGSQKKISQTVALFGGQEQSP